MSTAEVKYSENLTYEYECIGFLVDEINSLLRMLVFFFYESKASELQEALESLTKTVDESLNDIWNADQDSTSAMVSNNTFALHVILRVAFV